MEKLSRKQKYQDLRNQIEENTTEASSRSASLDTNYSDLIRPFGMGEPETKKKAGHASKGQQTLYSMNDDIMGKPAKSKNDDQVINALLGEVKQYNIDNGNRLEDDTQINILLTLENEKKIRRRHILPMEEKEDASGETRRMISSAESTNEVPFFKGSPAKKGKLSRKKKSQEDTDTFKDLFGDINDGQSAEDISISAQRAKEKDAPDFNGEFEPLDNEITDKLNILGISRASTPTKVVEEAPAEKKSFSLFGKSRSEKQREQASQDKIEKMKTPDVTPRSFDEVKKPEKTTYDLYDEQKTSKAPVKEKNTAPIQEEIEEDDDDENEEPRRLAFNWTTVLIIILILLLALAIIMMVFLFRKLI